MKYSTNKGFSLMEVIVAIFVITIGIAGVTTLVNSSISSVSFSKSQIIAANLAQEGIEVVRNIRDTNWLETEAWNTGLASGDWRVQYNSSALLTLSGNALLKIELDGTYSYDSGADTFFRRKISISNVSAYEIKVTSEVAWSEKGRSHVISVENRLYDWK